MPMNADDEPARKPPEKKEETKKNRTNPLIEVKSVFTWKPDADLQEAIDEAVKGSIQK